MGEEGEGGEEEEVGGVWCAVSRWMCRCRRRVQACAVSPRNPESTRCPTFCDRTTNSEFVSWANVGSGEMCALHFTACA